MTATEFRQTHPDPTAWTTADHESYDVLLRNDAHLARNTPTCRLCHAETPTSTDCCESCDGHIQTGIDRLRALLAPAA